MRADQRSSAEGAGGAGAARSAVGAGATPGAGSAPGTGSAGSARDTGNAGSARDTGNAGAAAHAATGARYPLVRIYRTTPYQLTLLGVARRSGLPPDLVRRFVALGLVDAEHDGFGRLWFRTTAPAAIARVQRLRTGLSLNYAAVGVVLDLLDRIEHLETALRHSERAARERTPWT